MTKICRAEKFLNKGNKVKTQLQFRGREMAHQELGYELMQRVKADLATMSAVETEPKMMGRSINMMLSPLPANRRKLRWTSHEDAELEVEDEDEEDDEAEG